MANSDHEWDLFLGKEHAVQAEYGTGEPEVALVADVAQSQPALIGDPQPGALFDIEEFRRDGQRRLL
jgi:hypothetical protein